MKKSTLIMAGALAFVVGFVAIAAKPEAEKTLTIKYDQLAKATLGEKPPPVFPDELKKLEGKQVRITGFVAPYDDPEKLQKLLLVETPGGCFFCNPPDANAVVFVRRDPKDPKLPETYDAITVEGTLHLWRAEMKEDDDAKRFLFTIDDAKARASK